MSGPRFTSNMEKMIQDVESSFRLCQRNATDEGDVTVAAELSALYLTRGLWPTLPVHPVQPPKLFITFTSKLELEYAGHFPRRTLAWQYSLGEVTVSYVSYIE